MDSFTPPSPLTSTHTSFNSHDSLNSHIPIHHKATEEGEIEAAEKAAATGMPETPAAATHTQPPSTITSTASQTELFFDRDTLLTNYTLPSHPLPLSAKPSPSSTSSTPPPLLPLIILINPANHHPHPDEADFPCTARKGVGISPNTYLIVPASLDCLPPRPMLLASISASSFGSGHDSGYTRQAI
ncbi:hypothetical protein CYMTET_47263 [Cymbomonas tetramitiformis]|uniref:Uncharacterized protein n=1 Tax=Cymbomonas tetramitiformis TaxID=36881 RepID=A0AAE0EWR9_9CHLO|nr:hypothetical protein CYMTET_47263 [Cymbomonas tetramitiformis]